MIFWRETEFDVTDGDFSTTRTPLYWKAAGSPRQRTLVHLASLTWVSSCRPDTSLFSTQSPRRSYCDRYELHSPLCWTSPTPSAKAQETPSPNRLHPIPMNTCGRSSSYLRVVGAHRSIALERASGLAVSGVREGVVFDLVVPRLHELEDRSIATDRRTGWDKTQQGFC